MAISESQGIQIKAVYDAPTGFWAAIPQGIVPIEDELDFTPLKEEKVVF